MTIYDVVIWASGTVYNKNTFIKNGNYFYYALQTHTSTSSFTTDLNNNLWGGVATSGLDTKSLFLWRPSYNYTIDNKPKVKTIQFSDGYSQNTPDGINNLLLSFDFQFEDRDLDETTAILHFLNQRGGSESFLYLAPDPYGVIKRFICKEWSDRQTFYNAYTINAKFDEVTI